VRGGGVYTAEKEQKKKGMRLLCRDGIHESTISFRYPRMIFRFLSLEVSSFVIAFFQNAYHEQT